MAEALGGASDVAGAIHVHHPAQNVPPSLSAQEECQLDSTHTLALVAPGKCIEQMDKRGNG